MNQIPSLPLTGCIALKEALNFSVPQSSDLENEDDNDISDPVRLLGGLSELMYVKHIKCLVQKTVTGIEIEAGWKDMKVSFPEKVSVLVEVTTGSLFLTDTISSGENGIKLSLHRKLSGNWGFKIFTFSHIIILILSPPSPLSKSKS